MPTKTEQSLGLSWGAPLGETPWNVWMDSNLVKLGAVAQISIVNDTNTSPPAFVEGNRYIVATGATGAWGGYDGQIAFAVDGTWQFYPVRKGWVVHNQTDDSVKIWNGTSYLQIGADLVVDHVADTDPHGDRAYADGIVFTEASARIAADNVETASRIAGDASTLAAAQTYADGLVEGRLSDRGNYDASTDLFPASGGSGPSGAVLKGDIWTISVAGTLGGTAVSIGDWLRSLVDSPGQTAGNWTINHASGGSGGQSMVVVLYSGGSYPARPAGVAAGLVQYIGPTEPTDALTGDLWLRSV